MKEVQMEIKLPGKFLKKTWQQKKFLCEQWRVSGQNKREFCKENNIPLATFFGWCNKFFPEAKEKSVNLLPVKIIKTKSLVKEVQEQTDIELILGDAIIRFKLPFKNIVSFIQELSHATTTIR